MLEPQTDMTGPGTVRRRQNDKAEPVADSTREENDHERHDPDTADPVRPVVAAVDGGYRSRGC